MNTLRLLRCALVLGEHGNFARAAEALRMSQPNLSRGIAEFEQSLGVTLFDRTRKGVIPTAFGRLLLARGEAVLRSEASLRRELQLLAGLESGTLAVGAGPFAGETSVAAAIAQVLQQHPKLSINFQIQDPDQVIQDVLDERSDVGVAQVTGLEADPRLVVTRLPPLRVYMACRPGHPLTRIGKPTFGQALEYPLATNIIRGPPAVAVRTRDGSRVESEARSPQVVPQVVVNSPAASRLIARLSDALAVGTGEMLVDDVAAGHLVLLPVDAPIMRSVHGIVHLRDRSMSPAARAFIAALHAVEERIRSAEPTLPGILGRAQAKGALPRKPARKSQLSKRTRKAAG
jgi:DNA-binding transcriptional LysR family regulator